MSNEEDYYPCVGICQADPDSGYCIGCGRPPLATPEIVTTLEAKGPTHAASDDNAEDAANA